MINEREPEATTKPKLDFRFLLTGAWIGGLVFCLIFSVATVFLGEWQMDRRMEKLEEINKIVGNYDIDPVSYQDAGYLFENFDEQHKWTPIIVQGEYLEQDTVVARNRPRHGVPGFEGLVPFLTESGDRLLVDIGWLPLAADATAPDCIPAPPQVPTRTTTRVDRLADTLLRGSPDIH